MKNSNKMLRKEASMNLLNNKKTLWILSIIATMIFAFIPNMGIRLDGPYHYFGFPAQWLGYYKGPRLTFDILGLLFDILFFYFVLIILNKILKKILKSTTR
ncbi:hypothetical protein ABEP18_28230 [Priestia megaterium]